MLTTTPVTQRDVAQACGMHHSTVCLALKNSPTLAAETRHRIQATARELGYQPNVSAYNLASMRKDRPQNASLPLAWINQETDRAFWHTHSQGKISFAAMRHRAGEQGYHLDEFWAHEPGMSVARLSQILRARGIQGVIFPVYQNGDLALSPRAWAQFSCVALNDHRLAQWLDVVSPDYYHLMDLALRQAESHPPARIGLVLDREFDALSNGLVRSRYLRYQEELGRAQRLAVCTLSNPGFADIRAFEQWSAAWEPDVVICRDAVVAGSLGSTRRGVIVTLQSHGEEGDGQIDVSAALAAAAIESVTRKIQRFETGIGGLTQLHLIRGHARPSVSAQCNATNPAHLPSLAA